MRPEECNQTWWHGFVKQGVQYGCRGTAPCVVAAVCVSSVNNEARIANRAGSDQTRGMPHARRAAMPPPKPTLVYDGECGLCCVAVHSWQPVTGAEVDYLPARDAGTRARFPEIPDAQVLASVQLVETDGGIYTGAEAIFRALARGRSWHWPLRAYRSFPTFAGATERAYRFVARRREGLSRFMHWCESLHITRPSCGRSKIID
jgi:predicted DCC family thiol-disulfide oxidoreductase YuxK